MDFPAAVWIEPLARALNARGGSITIDADAHATDTVRYPPRAAHYYHGRPVSAEDLVCEMDLAGVSIANVWQNPAATAYPGGEDENAEALLAANRYIHDAARRYPGRFIPSGWTDPKALGVANACRLATICVRELGFVLIKMNPAQNRYPIDSAPVRAVFDHIIELGAVPVFHYGADSPFTPAAGLEALAARRRDWPLVAVHMGGGGAGYLEAETLYHETLDLGLRCPNVRFILSALRDSYIEEAFIRYQIAGPPFSENLFCASDAPYGRMAWNFGGFRLMLAGLLDGARHPDQRVRARPGLFTEDAVEDLLGRNFARFVVAAHQRLMRIQQAVPA